VKFVTVYRALNEIEAGMVRAFLEDQGIKAKISSEVPGMVYGLATEEVKVQVDAADEARALEWVGAYFSAEPVEPQNPEETAP